MNGFAKGLCAALAGVALMASASAEAATVGVAVDAIGSDTVVGATVDKPALGGESIQYFVPLSGDPTGSCVFGVNCGTAADTGTGGPTMSMFLKFDPVSTVQPSILTINFEDLDLDGANDPNGFLESIEIFNNGGTSLTGLITDIGGLVTGDDDMQVLTLGLGTLGMSPYWAELRFQADGPRGTNTAEFLRATISPVPVPAALPLLVAGLAGLGLLGRRRRRAEA